ncbi:hypothetical protein ES288_D07G119400v1 [Gossypium darwinii]|uniref:Uncharacterized protein n=1 Tax=Gossypium darwinii TaxID=34276 RepID=A0A5D2BUR3_GOSDA|nr:hypothetical protein ES288_D07G119400v1 [Gossypium darwinii]
MIQISKQEIVRIQKVLACCLNSLLYQQLDAVPWMLIDFHQSKIPKPAPSSLFFPNSKINPPIHLRSSTQFQNQLIKVQTTVLESEKQVTLKSIWLTLASFPISFHLHFLFRI